MSRFPPPSLSVNLPFMEKVPASELTPTRLCFPNEFPYEFDSPVFSPGFTSPGNSTETEDESSDDEEDFLAGLTSRLAPSTHRLPPPPPPSSVSFNTKAEVKRPVVATSPQSTLSGLGSFSNSRSQSPNLFLPSPVPTSSFRRDNAWEVISAAAGEVARLQIGSYGSHLPRQTLNPNSLLRRTNAALEADHRLQQQRLLWLCSQARIKPSVNHIPNRVVNNDVTFENLRYVSQNTLSNPQWLLQHAGTPLKRPSSGTGVFLPRQYPVTPSDAHKKPAMLQSKVNQQNLNFNQFDYEFMLSRARQGSLRAVGDRCLNQEVLPQDWMY